MNYPPLVNSNVVDSSVEGVHTPTIHLLKTRLVNSYIIEYPDKLLVIDVAVRCHRHVLGFIEHDLQRDLNQVKLVVCTHDDPDHMGGTAQVAQQTGARWMIPYASKSTWRKALNNPTGFLMRALSSAREITRGRAWQMYANPERDQKARDLHQKYHEQARQHRINTDAEAESEEFTAQARYERLHNHQTLPMFDDWQVIHTPGHSWDSVCYYHAGSGSLIAGDTLLGSGKQNRLVTAAIYSDGRALRNSLAVLGRLPIRTVYPGHGSAIAGDDLIAQAQIQSVMG